MQTVTFILHKTDSQEHAARHLCPASRILNYGKVVCVIHILQTIKNKQEETTAMKLFVEGQIVAYDFIGLA